MVSQSVSINLLELTKQLIRQYSTSETEFSNINEKQILEIQHKINRKPREILNFEIPKSLIYKLVANVAFVT